MAEDYEKMAEAIRRGMQGTGGGFDASAFAGLTKGAVGATDALNPFSKALGKAADAISAVNAVVDKSLGTWQSLSSSGASFNNDIIGMNLAASGTRMSMQEFSDTIKKNTTAFSGLGGSVSQNAMTFSKLSKDMFDSGITDQLRAMGMNTRDINDALALQMGAEKAGFNDTKQGRIDSLNSAKALATEMDAMAKLTGKTREEQSSAMRAAQADMQAEAKIRLQAGGDVKKEAELRAEYQKQYKDAEARGQGQYFKEIFATGHVMSQEAATQGAALGAQAEATANQAKATAAGNFEDAKKYGEQAKVEAIRNNQDVNKLTMASYGDATGAYGKAIMNNMTQTQTMFENEKKIRNEAAFKGASDEQVHAEAMRRIKNEQLGKDAKTGEDIAGAGTTQAILKLKARTEDVQNALLTGLVTPLNKDIGPKLKIMADRYLSPTVDRKTKTGVETTNVATAVQDTVTKAYYDKGSDKDVKGKIKERNGGEGYFGADVVGGIGHTVGASSRLLTSGIDKALGIKPEPTGDKSSTAAPATTTAASQPVSKATLDDVVEKLDQLNKNMSNVATHTENLNDATNKQVKATKDLSGKRF